MHNKLSFCSLLAFVLLNHLASAQLAKDSLTVNAFQAIVFADGNIGEMKDAQSGKMLNYLTQLQLTAKDSSGQLLSAAQFYQQSGRDLQPGPVSSSSNARAFYNRVWRINKTTTDSFTAGLFNGTVPLSIANWPAHGNTSFGESFFLAPFVDVNGNGYYNPSLDGDYPCFLGDQAIFFLFNDDTVHTKTNTAPLGMEVLGMAYAYKENNFLDSVLFVDYTIRLKKQKLIELRVGVLNDFDIGMWIDDMVGCFVDQNTAIAYNGDIEDEGPFGFGFHPPAAGCVIRSGLKADFGDGIDNNKDGCIDGVRNSLGNCMAENTSQNIIEYWKLTSHIYPWVNASVNVPPIQSPAHSVYNTIQGLWPWGDSLYKETPSGFLNMANGDGYLPGGNANPTTFAFPGNTYDTSGSFIPMSPTNWYQSPNHGGDKRSIAGLGHTSFANIGEELQISVAHYFARDTNTLNSFDAAYAMAKKINAFVDSVPNCSGSRLIAIPEEEPLKTISIYPNPAQDLVTIVASKQPSAKGEVVGVDGRVLLTFQTDQSGHAAVGVGNLPNGVYVIRIGEKTERLLIQK